MKENGSKIGRFSGFFYPPFDGTFKFLLTGTMSAKLFIDNSEDMSSMDLSSEVVNYHVDIEGQILNHECRDTTNNRNVYHSLSREYKLYFFPAVTRSQ